MVVERVVVRGHSSSSVDSSGGTGDRRRSSSISRSGHSSGGGSASNSIRGVGLLLVIFTSSINILVLYLLVLLAI